MILVNLPRNGQMLSLLLVLFYEFQGSALAEIDSATTTTAPDFDDFIRAPENAAANVGEMVSFHCAVKPVNDWGIIWSRILEGSRADELIFNGQRIASAYKDRFDFDWGAASGQVVLILKRANSTDAGRYICTEKKSNRKFAATLTVLSPAQQCSSNFDSDQHTGSALCRVLYSGPWAPAVEWYVEGGEQGGARLPINATLIKRGSYVVSNVSVSGLSFNGSVLVARTLFLETFRPRQGMNATNVPTYSQEWESERIKWKPVPEPPEALGLSIHPADVSSKAIGSFVLWNCTVNVSDVTLKWFDPSDREITSTLGRVKVELQQYLRLSRLHVTSINKGDEGRYTCRAAKNQMQQELPVMLQVHDEVTSATIIEVSVSSVTAKPLLPDGGFADTHTGPKPDNSNFVMIGCLIGLFIMVVGLAVTIAVLAYRRSHKKRPVPPVATTLGGQCSVSFGSQPSASGGPPPSLYQPLSEQESLYQDIDELVDEYSVPETDETIQRRRAAARQNATGYSNPNEIVSGRQDSGLQSMPRKGSLRPAIPTPTANGPNPFPAASSSPPATTMPGSLRRPQDPLQRPEQGPRGPAPPPLPDQGPPIYNTEPDPRCEDTDEYLVAVNSRPGFKPPPGDVITPKYNVQPGGKTLPPAGHTLPEYSVQGKKGPEEDEEPGGGNPDDVYLVALTSRPGIRGGAATAESGASDNEYNATPTTKRKDL